MPATTYVFCSRRCAEKFEAAPGDYPRRAAEAGEIGFRRADLHLPDASRDRAGRARRLPDLRHGARAQDGKRRGRGAERGAARHDAALLDQRRARLAAAGLGDGRPPARRRSRPRDPARDSRTGSSSSLATPVVLWAGWPVFKRCWASFVQHEPEHVDADRHRRRRGLPLQRGRDGGARHLPGRVPRARGTGRRLLRGRGGDHRARAARPGARDPRARAHQRRDQGAARPGAQDRAPGAR